MDNIYTDKCLERENYTSRSESEAGCRNSKISHPRKTRSQTESSSVKSLQELKKSKTNSKLFIRGNVAKKAIGFLTATIQQKSAKELQTNQSTAFHDISRSETNRRGVLQTAGVALTAGSLGLMAATDRTIAAHQMDREQHTILKGTQYETTVYTLTSPNEDEARTAMIFGGVHGNERGGIDAAHLATDYTINRGKLVVIPEANKPAVERNNNHGPEGDLNRQFPVHGDPITDVAEGLWEEILRVDPELIIDMHTSTTLYQRGSVGQAIFPTSGVIEHAENTVEYLNTNYMKKRVATDLPNHGFRVGNTIAEKYPLLVHKAAGDQNIAGWLTEVTRIGLLSEQRMYLHDMMTRELLRQSGIDVISAPSLNNPL